MFSRAEAEYIHLHNANRGCFSCAVRRTDRGELHDAIPNHAR
jgi:hypothetical protein